MNIINERKKDLTSILTDIEVRETDIERERESLQSAKKAIKKELYQLSGKEKSTPLFLLLREN